LCQKEKIELLGLLTYLETTINDSGSDDFGRYVTMGLRLEPDNPDILERNVK